MKTQTITSFFAEDHDRLDKLFAQWQAQKHVDFPVAKNAFREFLMGLRRHIDWEEKILFPVFDQKTGLSGNGPTAVMREEHREIKRVLENMHEFVRGGDIHTDRLEGALLAVLKEHNMKEENILYPALDSMTDDEERRKIFTEIERISESDGSSACCCGFQGE